MASFLLKLGFILAVLLVLALPSVSAGFVYYKTYSYVSPAVMTAPPVQYSYDAFVTPKYSAGGYYASSYYPVSYYYSNTYYERHRFRPFRAVTNWLRHLHNHDD